MNMLLIIQGWLAGLPLSPAWLMLAKITLILAGGWLLHGAFARLNPRWRVLLWRMVAAGLAALPLLLGLDSPIELPVPVAIIVVSSTPPPVADLAFPQPPAAERAPRRSAPVPVAASARPGAPLTPAPALGSEASVPPPAPAPSRLDAPPAARRPLQAHWLAALWLAGVAFMVLRWVAGWRRLRRLVGEASPAPEAMLALLKCIAGDLGCRAAALRLDARVPTPLIAGWRRPVLLLPARMADPAYREELPAIIAHELSHLRAGDLLWTQLVYLLQALLWFHPLAWRVGHAHGSACEAVSDAAAAAYVGDTGAYSRTLARVAVELAELPPLAGGIAMARVPEVMHRLARLRRRVFANPLSRPAVRAFAIGFMMLVGLLGALRITQAQAGKGGIDLLKTYPTPLSEGDMKTHYKYQLTADDIYEISDFSLAIGDPRHSSSKDLRIHTGRATVGFGVTDVGATFAIVIPQKESLLRGPTLGGDSFQHLWLRFHPGQIARLFPPASILGPGDKSRLKTMRQITEVKVINSYYAGVRGVSHVLIPPPNRMTVDADTLDGKRRFFSVDREGGTAEYVSQMEKQTVAAAGGKPQAAPVMPGRPDAFSQYATHDYQRLCDVFKVEYPFFAQRPDVDWAKLCDKYRAAAIGAKSDEEFAGVLKTMLAELRDDHIQIKVGQGDCVPVYGQPRPANVNPAAWATLLNPRNEASNCIEWSTTADKIGLVVIHGWDGQTLDDRFDELLEEMRDTRALIIDVRDTQNSGRTQKTGEIAGRFTDREVKYGYHEYFMGGKNPFGKMESTLSPRGPWCYDRPTLVLIGPHTTEGTELFAAMLAACPQVKTVGERSDGGYGTLNHVMMMSAGVEVRIPREVDYRPDKQPLSGRGLTPDLPVAAGPAAFRGDKDPVIEAALAAARSHPVPPRPIAGESITHVREAARAREERRPKVVRVEPASGAQGIDTQSEVRIWFDQAMDPVRINLSSGENKFLDAEPPQYDAGEHKFTIPLRLKPGLTYHVEVNKPDFSDGALEGFSAPGGLAARSYSWAFQTRGTSQTLAQGAPPAVAGATPAAAPVPGGDAALAALLTKVAEKRRQLKSISEVISSIGLSGDKDGFNRISSFWTTYKWQGPQHCYGAFDSSRGLFEVGFDGRECWMRYQQNVTAVPAGEVEYKNVQVGELFQPRPQNGQVAPPLDVAAQIKNYGLVYQGTTTLNGRKCHLVYEGQNKHTWWIDDELALPAMRLELRVDPRYTSKHYFLFVYDRINQPIPEAEFGYGDPAKTVVNRPEPLDENYKHRFINVIDANCGSGSIRLGKFGPKGTSSSGLN